MHAGPGLGGQSRKATEKLERLVFPELAENRPVRLIVTEEPLGVLPSVTEVRAEVPGHGAAAVKAPV